MKSWPIAARALSITALLGFLITCGGGGASSSGGSSVEKVNNAPVTTPVTWTPVDDPLVRFKSYTFKTTGSDPDLGDSVVKYEWDFGDGSAVVSTTTDTAPHYYQVQGTYTLKVRATDNRGLTGNYTSKQISVDASPSPIVVAFTNPTAPTKLSTDVGVSSQLVFVVSVQNDSGSPIDASGIRLDAGDGTKATVGTPVLQSGILWRIPVDYQADTVVGTRNATPTIQVVNAAGISSGTITGPVITIDTLAGGNTAPVIAVTTPSGATGTANAAKPFTLAFTLTDTQGDVVTYSVDWGDGTAASTGTTSTDTKVGAAISLQHSYSDTWTGTGKTATLSVTAADGRTNGQATAVTKDVAVTANRAPQLLITAPASQSPTAYTSKPVSLGLSLSDQDGDQVSYTVNWGDGTADTTGNTGTSDTKAGVSLSLDHAFPDSFTSGTKAAIVKVNATDSRASGTAQEVSRTFTVTFNTFPTGSITSPQASGTLPSTTDLPNDFVPGLKNPPGANDPDIIVIPNGGRLAFSASSTLPGSQDSTLTYSWTFQNGSPITTSNVINPGEVYFYGEDGKVTPCLVEFKVFDAFGRDSSKATGVNPKTYRKWVIVDGKNTQLFKLSFMYRLKSDNNGTSTLSTVTTAANGKGVDVQIFQDGQSNTWTVADQADTKAATSIPVRSNLPFYIKLPKDIAGDPQAYLMRIPNAPTGVYADPALGTTLNTSISSFGFENATAPWNPTLQVVTAQGFAAETAPGAERRIQGTVAVYGWLSGTDPFLSNERWLDRLTVPLKASDFSDPLGALSQWNQSSNSAGSFAGVRANQLFAEWPMVIRARELKVPTGNTVLELPSKPATGMGFLIDYNTYARNTTAKSTVVYVDEMQVFRVPKGSTDPYDLDAAGWASGKTKFYTQDFFTQAPVPSYLTQGPAYWNNWIFQAPGSTPLSGGINNLPIPYDKNDPDRTPAAPVTRAFTGLASIFSYSEYLWSSVWARPVVLNTARLRAGEASSSGGITGFTRFANSQPSNGVWPSAASVSPDGAAGNFDMKVVGGGVFDGSSPVVAPGSGKGVGRFYWTAYTPFYEAAGGSVISRTWLAEGSGTQQPPIAFSGAVSGDATSAFGLVPPQDVVVDKRGRNANGTLNGSSLGGYRVTWFNPTVDAAGAPVPPDFWVIEFEVGGQRNHYMLPASYPASAQAATDLVLTDARTFLPSGSMTRQTGDTVAPGYCWFDVPLELRPDLQDPQTTSYITVFGLRSVLKNNKIAAARPLNRLDWIDAIKTVSATINISPSTNVNLAYAHKIPFNYGWDIVVVNSARTPVAP